MEEICLAKDLVHDFQSWMEGVHDGSIEDKGLRWGFDGLGDFIPKLRPGELCVVGGLPGSGKTSIANSFIAYSCVPFGHPAAIFSLEMTKRQAVMRLVSIIGKFPLEKLQDLNLLSNQDYAIINQAVSQLYCSKIGITDSIYDIYEIQAAAKKHKDNHGLDVIVIDHAQLVSVKGVPDVVAKLDEVGRLCKIMSKELDATVFLLTQVNKYLVKNKWVIGGPFNSSAIEQHADQYVIVYKEEKKSYDSGWIIKKQVEVRKNRNGPMGECQINWRPECAAFY